MQTSSTQTETVRIPIHVEERAGHRRRGEPVSIGVPLPIGLVRDADAVALVDAQAIPLPCQSRVLLHWADGSVKWLLVDFVVTLEAGELTSLFLETRRSESPPRTALVVSGDGDIRVETGVAAFEVARKGASLLRCSGAARGSDTQVTLRVLDREGRVGTGSIESVTVEGAGSVRATVVAAGEMSCGGKGLRFLARLSFFAGSALVKLELTVHNPQAARHIGNVWDLGDPGSISFEDLSLLIRPSTPVVAVEWQATAEADWQTGRGACTVYQDSSGGEYWDSTNHLDMNGTLTVAFRGYEVRAEPSQPSAGLRAQPIVAAVIDGSRVAVAVEDFWQNFPKALRCSAEGLAVGLFPSECRAPFELQGGEQKRHTVWLAWSGVDEEAAVPISRAPVNAWVDPAHVGASGAVAYLGPDAPKTEAGYRAYIDSIVAGSNSFFATREIIDEYGWRNFGDLYADHEAVGWKGEKPLVSHYNNQYDFIRAAGVNFLRTGDERWRALCSAAARHMIDIDIYHTDQDRAAYNGGLFWHTEHYRDAATCTHRSYSRFNGSGSGYGGGPADEHNYTSGLLLYHCFTGDPDARRAVLGLADWVIAMDDGSRTIFGILTDQPTGEASKTRSTDYHKPGRGAGNSINALIDAYALSQRREYLLKAEELIRRVIHPRDDVAALQLDDPENRWSYLVFLQVLGKYLEVKEEYGELDYHFFWARDSLLHYSAWVLDNEVPYSEVLDRVDIPSETWPAQDIRKAHVLHLAAVHTTGPARAAFSQRAIFFAERCLADVLCFETAYLARPRVLISVYEPAITYFEQSGYGSEHAERTRAHGYVFGEPTIFVPQRQRLKAAGVAKLALLRRELSRLLSDKLAGLINRFRRRPGAH